MVMLSAPEIMVRSIGQGDPDEPSTHCLAGA